MTTGLNYTLITLGVTNMTASIIQASNLIIGMLLILVIAVCYQAYNYYRGL